MQEKRCEFLEVSGVRSLCLSTAWLLRSGTFFFGGKLENALTPACRSTKLVAAPYVDTQAETFTRVRIYQLPCSTNAHKPSIPVALPSAGIPWRAENTPGMQNTYPKSAVPRPRRFPSLANAAGSKVAV